MTRQEDQKHIFNLSVIDINAPLMFLYHHLILDDENIQGTYNKACEPVKCI